MRQRLAAFLVAPALFGCDADEKLKPAAPPRSTDRTLIASVHDSDLWLYDAAADRTDRLTRNGAELSESRPTIRSANAVAFLAGGSLREIDPATRRSRSVRPPTVLAFAWSGDKRTLAYVAQAGGRGRHVLFLYRPGSRLRPRVVRRFSGPVLSRGDGGSLTPDDEITLSWSPDARRLLLVDTHLASNEPTLYVFGANGHEQARRNEATHGGWIDGSRLYFRALRTSAWSLLDVQRGTQWKLSIRHGRMHPALSPDGRYLAFDDGRPWQAGSARKACTCTLWLYDFRTERERKLATGLVAPIWLTPRSLVATEVRGCAGGECGADVPMWVARGQAARVDVATGRRARLTLPSTLDADVLAGASRR